MDSSGHASAALLPTATHVWGIEPINIQDLTSLRDFIPDAQTTAEQFVGSCKNLAARLITRPNLIDHYNSNATAAGQLTLARQKNRELEEENDLLSNRVDRLETELEMTKQSLLLFQRTATANPEASASTPDRNTIKLPDPPTFTKGRAEYRTFKAKLKAKLRGDKDRFRSEDHMLEYAMGFLTGEAHETAESLRDNGQIASVEQLLTYLDSGYEDPDRKGTAQRELNTLRQGGTDFTAHFAKFQAIMAVLGWEGEPRQAALERSLSNEIKDALVLSHTPVGETYIEFVERVKALDDRIRRRAAEKGSGKPPGHTTPSTRPGPRTQLPQGRHTGYSSNPKDSTGATPHTGPAPMDLAAQQRMEAKQAQYAEWAEKGVCTKCGDSTHWRRDCPKNKQLYQQHHQQHFQQQYRKPLKAAATTCPNTTCTDPACTDSACTTETPRPKTPVVSGKD
jgi:hypothetical protein